MDVSQVFDIAGMITMPMWLLMIILPKWKVTQFLMDYKIIPIILSIIYLVFIGFHISKNGMMDFGSLSSVMNLFTDKVAVLAGWVHYLAFDLLIGMWIIKQNEKTKIHQILLAPILLFTFMLGPIGFLLFITIRTIKKQLS